MNINTLAIVIALTAVACDKKEPPKTEAPATTATASAAAVVATATATVAVAAPVVDDVETEEDFAAEVESITKASMESELSKLEKDIK
jgi:hypothetical protein